MAFFKRCVITEAYRSMSSPPICIPGRDEAHCVCTKTRRKLPGMFEDNVVFSQW